MMYTYIFFLIPFSFFLLFLLLMFGTFVVFGFFLRQAAFLCLLLFSLTNNHPGIRPVLAHLTGPRRGGGRTVGCVGRSGADLLTSACAPGRQNKAGVDKGALVCGDPQLPYRDLCHWFVYLMGCSAFGGQTRPAPQSLVWGFSFICGYCFPSDGNRVERRRSSRYADSGPLI